MLATAHHLDKIGALASARRPPPRHHRNTIRPAAEDWLNPATVKEVFEARALRMVVNCAQNISKAPSQEEGFYELSPD
ncbi:hypothetical protein ZWY2020_058336 [Hordeum vulgare]|nr:hypothetical protein ZWY2020_058336 [Hordeum vulgare]